MSPVAASPRVRLVVRSTSGQFEEEFNRENRVEKILDEAIRRWGLATSGVTYVIKRERGDVVMQPADKLATYDLVDGDVIIIQSSQAGDG